LTERTQFRLDADLGSLPGNSESDLIAVAVSGQPSGTTDVINAPERDIWTA
jgi:hypothetical protein